MAKANASAAKTWNTLPQGFRTMTITQVMERPGRTPDPETGELGSFVTLTYKDKETGENVLQNYSLLKPTFLREVLLGICEDDEERADYLLNNIDWATSDAQEVFGIEIKAYVDVRDFQGRPTNGVGRVVSMDAFSKMPGASTGQQSNATSVRSVVTEPEAAAPSA